MPRPVPLIPSWPRSLYLKEWAWVYQLKDQSLRDQWILRIAEWEAISNQSQRIVQEPPACEKTRAPRQKPQWKPVQEDQDSQKGKGSSKPDKPQAKKGKGSSKGQKAKSNQAIDQKGQKSSGPSQKTRSLVHHACQQASASSTSGSPTEPEALGPIQYQ